MRSNQERDGSVEVTGIRFDCGTVGIREMCFTYMSYKETVMVKVTAGDPAQLTLVSGPKQVEKGSNSLISKLCYTVFLFSAGPTND